jgi:hypothetical protein
VAAALGAVVSSRAVNQPSSSEQAAALRKVAPWVIQYTAGGKQVEFMIILADQTDLSGAALLKSKAEKGRFVRDTLWKKSQAAQKSILKWLDEHQLEHRSFYIVNAIWVKGRYEDALALASRSDVARVEGNPQAASRTTRQPFPHRPSPPHLTRLNPVSLTLMLLLFGRKDSSARASWWPVQTPASAGLTMQSSRITAAGMA